MKVSTIVAVINRLTSNQSSYQLSYSQLEFYLDSIVDEINQELNENFLTIREAVTLATSPIEPTTNDILDFDYQGFTSMYIRSVLVYGATALFLEEEDELEAQYQQYKYRYKDALVRWKRKDYSVYDITDSTYPYEIVEYFRDPYENTKQLGLDLQKLIDEIEGE